MKIFAPSPRIYPSVLNSRAGAATEFAKPVMGTSVPAPACFAMRSYQPRPVRSADKNIKVIDTDIEALSLDKPKYKYISNSDCPITHISPPNKNAFGMVTHHLVPWKPPCTSRCIAPCLNLYPFLSLLFSIVFAPIVPQKSMLIHILRCTIFTRFGQYVAMGLIFLYSFNKFCTM